MLATQQVGDTFKTLLQVILDNFDVKKLAGWGRAGRGTIVFCTSRGSDGTALSKYCFTYPPLWGSGASA